MKIWGVRGLAVLMALTVLVAGCGVQPAAPQATPGQAQQPTAAKPQAAPKLTELRIGMGAFPKNPDPTSEASLYGSAVYRLAYDTMVYVGKDGKPEGALLESWRTVDPTTWEFKVRSNVKFHNGEPFDANAAKFALDRTRDPKSVQAQRLRTIKQVDVVDPQTIRIITNGPWSTLLANLVVVYGVPPQYYQEKGIAGFSAAPIGTGPYRVKEWRPDDFIVFEANSSYHRGAPKVNTIRFRMLPDDSSRIASLEAGELDLVYNLPPEHIERLKAKGFNVISSPIGQAMTLTIRGTIGGPLADRRVRQALNYAVDKEAIVKQLLAGSARILDGQMVGPNAFGYDPSIKAYPYDVAKAKQLLGEAGLASGFTVKFQCSQGRYMKDKEICEAIASQLAQVGIKSEIEILETGIWVDLFSNGKVGPLFVLPWSYAPPMDLEYSTNPFLCSGPRKVMCNKEFDELFQQQATATDVNARAAILRKYAQLFHDEAPVIFLFEMPGIYGAAPAIKSFPFLPDYSFDPLAVQST